MVAKGISLNNKLEMILLAIAILALVTISLQYKIIQIGAFSLGFSSFEIVERLFSK